MSEAHKHKYTKEEIESPDWFHKTVTRLSDYVLKHKKQIIISVIAVAIIIGGIFGYFGYIQYVEDQLRQSVREADFQLETLDYTSEENINKVLAEYRTIIGKNLGTVVADYAGMRRAQILNRLNFEDKTVTELQSIAGSTTNDPFYRSIAAFKLVQIHRNNNQFEQAIKVLNNFSVIEFEERKLFELGLTYLLGNDIEKAKTNFTKLMDQFKESPYNQFSEAILKSL